MTQYGKTADSAIKEIPEKYAVKIDNYVIMPNHIHLLIQIDDYGENRAIRESPLQGRSVISTGGISADTNTKEPSLYTVKTGRTTGVICSQYSITFF